MSNSSVSSRDGYIDILRAFGLLCLLVAHTAAPYGLTVFRSFDVPLMVFISAICFKPSQKGYAHYVINRFKRIYLPVVYFLIFFFIIRELGSVFIPQLENTWPKVIGSFLLLNQPSVGYVWIMRVFLMAALIIPFLYSFVRHNGMLVMIITVTSLFIINEAIIYVLESVSSKIVHFIVQEYVIYLIAYSIIIILGIWAHQAAPKNIFKMICYIILGFIVYKAYTSDWSFMPQADKYPPHGVYVIYGCFGSLVLWSLKPFLENIHVSPFITYLSKESMWLYLWHIIPAYAIIPINQVHNLWLGRFVFVLVSMILLQQIASFVVSKTSKFQHG